MALWDITEINRYKKVNYHCTIWSRAWTWPPNVGIFLEHLSSFFPMTFLMSQILSCVYVLVEIEPKSRRCVESSPFLVIEPWLLPEYNTYANTI